MEDLYSKRELQCDSRLGRLRSCLSGEHHFRATQELLYERMFDRALARLGIVNDFVPIKSAANFSLLFLIERCIAELDIRTVVELGAGQTTLLLDRLASLRDLQVTTIEDDPYWHAQVQAKVRHCVQLAPLESKVVSGHPSQTYSITIDLPARADFLIVDGPLGAAHRSRWGSLELVDRLVVEDFVVLYDDVNRSGDMETANEAYRMLKQKGLNPKAGKTFAAKSQVILAGGRFEAAAYL